MKRMLAIAGLAALAGCQSADPMVWVRTDGQRATGNPALEQQYKIDSAICVGETQKAGLGAPVVYMSADPVSAAMAGAVVGSQARASGDVMTGCMAQRGYVHVPMSQAPATAAALAATSQQRAASAPR